MPWEDRLRKGIYISPEQNRFEFEFVELVRASGKKAPTKELFGTNKSDTEDLGNRVIKLPLDIFFSGENYDNIADSFWAALNETGQGTLEHPRWGNLPVIPISFTQTENLVENTRRASFSIEFSIVDVLSFPQTTKQKEDEINNQLDDYQDKASESFGANISTETIEQEQAIIAYFNNLNTVIDNALSPLIEETEEIATEFNTVLNNITNNIDELLGEPITLAQNYIRLMRLPTRAENSINAKIEGYQTIFNTLFQNISPLNNQIENKNRAVQQELLGFACQGALVESSINTIFSPEIKDVAQNIKSTDELNLTTNIIFTKSQVITIIDNLTSTFYALITALDQKQKEFESVLLENQYRYSSESYELIKNMTNLTTALLVDKSFTLQIEKIIILNEDRTPIDLTFEFYKTIDLLDFFISSNKLIDEENYMVPRLREIVVYE